MGKWGAVLHQGCMPPILQRCQEGPLETMGRREGMDSPVAKGYSGGPLTPLKAGLNIESSYQIL